MFPTIPAQVERVVCINLARRTDRWVACQFEFSRLGLHAQRVEPVFHTSPEVSRCLTQAAILDSARRDRIDRLLVLEDDVQFVGLENLEEPPAFDLCYLGFTCHLDPPSAAEVDGQWLRLVRACHGCYAIIYPHHVLEEVISGLCEDRHRTPIDMWLANRFQPRGAVYCPHPPVAFVRDSPSDISTEPYRQFGKALTLGQYNTAATRLGWKKIIE